MDRTNHLTVMARLFSHLSGHQSSAGSRLALILLLAFLVHLIVKSIRVFSEWIVNPGAGRDRALDFVTRQPKFTTLIKLVANATTFIMYFFALGLALQELGVNLEGYLASASILALAISFGSQGLVQDVVIGLTLIFSDAMDVGDMVEIYCSTNVLGRVEEIGLRFTIVQNSFNQAVFIPNRTITNVSRFPHGGVYAYADVQLPSGEAPDKAVAAIKNLALGLWEQFGAIILSQPELGPVETTSGKGWQFVRVHFKIWPGQGNLIETTFRAQVIRAMQSFEPDYASWQVPVTYRTLTAVKKAP